jgi:hypothetical protein
MTITIKVARDAQAGVWYIANSDLPGLNLEGESLDELYDRLFLNSTLLRSFSAFACPGQDQMPFKFGKSAQHSQHQPPMRSGCVSPLVAQ